MFSIYVDRQVLEYRLVGSRLGSNAQVGYVALRVVSLIYVIKLVTPYASIFLGGLVGF